MGKSGGVWSLRKTRRNAKSGELRATGMTKAYPPRRVSEGLACPVPSVPRACDQAASDGKNDGTGDVGGLGGKPKPKAAGGVPREACVMRGANAAGGNGGAETRMCRYSDSFTPWGLGPRGAKLNGPGFAYPRSRGRTCIGICARVIGLTLSAVCGTRPTRYR